MLSLLKRVAGKCRMIIMMICHLRGAYKTGTPDSAAETIFDATSSADARLGIFKCAVIGLFVGPGFTRTTLILVLAKRC